MKKALQIVMIIAIVWFALIQVPDKTVQAVDVTNTISFISGVQITNTDGTALSSGVSKDTAIKLNYNFDVQNTTGIHQGDTFTLNVPKQINILFPGSFIINDADSGTAIANGTLSPDGTIVLVFTDFASQYPTVSGSFSFNLQFDKDQIGDTNPQPVIFNVGGTTQPVTVQVDFEQPAAPNVSIHKSGVLTAADEITWTITIDPENVVVNTPQVVDTIESGQEFIPGCVTVNGAAADASSFTFANGVLTYTFPAAISSQQIITLKTKVLDSEFSNASQGATLHECNNATLNHSGGAVVSNQPSVDIPVNFISQSGIYDDANKKIGWTINVDNVNVAIQNAVVTVTLPADLSPDAGSALLDGAPFAADTAALPVITFPLGNINTPHVITFSANVNAADSSAYHSEALLTGQGVPANTICSNDVTVPHVINTVSAGSGTIKFTNTDSASPLAGAVFTLYNAASQAITTATSGTDGVVLFKNIPLGVYTIQETTTPAGYNPAAALTVSLTEDGKTVETAATVDIPLSSIQFTKLDTGSRPLPRAEFTLYNAQGQDIKTAISGEYGIVLFQNIPIGDYTIRETQAPDGYAINTTTITASVTQSNQHIIANPSTIADSTEYGSIRLTTLSTFNETPIQDCAFALYFSIDEKYEYPLAIAITDEDGVAVFKGIPLGSYSIKELSAPAGYTKSDEVLSATIDEPGQTVDTDPDTLTDAPYLGDIQVITTSTDGQKLSGASYNLYLSSDTGFSNSIANVVSDNNGEALFRSIPYGSYAIREAKAPLGYYINSTVLYAQVSQDGQTVSGGTFSDAKIPTSASSPATGDAIQYYILVMVAAAAAAVILMLPGSGKKKIKYKPRH